MWDAECTVSPSQGEKTSVQFMMSISIENPFLGEGESTGEVKCYPEQ
jgi:hypothetical protein